MHTYTVNIFEEESGGYWAKVEELPGCYASGETLDDLERDIRDAIETQIEALTTLGEEVPQGRGGASNGRQRQWLISVA